MAIELLRGESAPGRGRSARNREKDKERVMIKAIRIAPSDNVACLTGEGKAGDTLDYESKEKEPAVTLVSDIPFGHKCAIRPIKRGELVIKYGKPIGAATESIEAGSHVHLHNCGGLRGRGDLKGGGER
jgi:altronate dehydratase small subunit